MYTLHIKSDNRYVGDLSDEELQFLRDNLEEESLTDTDYDLTRLTLEYLRGNGLTPRLAQLLESALGEQDHVQIVYQPK